MREFTAAEVAQHKQEGDLWLVVQGKVYDVSSFAAQHPGGQRTLLQVGGKDATAKFIALHNAEQVLREHQHLCIGTLASEGGDGKEKKRRQRKRAQCFGAIGEVPYSEPYWYDSECQTPGYYTEAHRQFRARVRRFVDAELLPYVHEWDEAGSVPGAVVRKAYDAGVYAPNWPAAYGGTPPTWVDEKGETRVAPFDAFMDLILLDELSRCASGGTLAFFFSYGIALPPVLRFGSDYLKEWVAEDVITGRKAMALAITEPYAGSDVAQLKTTAVRDGDFYMVNGEKKFITGGVKGDYYTVAVRTGGPGMTGISLLLVDSKTPGIGVRRMKTQGWWASNTAYITFTDVRVPVKNLIGQENHGFIAIMFNFNHERLSMAVQSNRYARVCIEEAIRYGRVRKTFGKRLVDHQAIRHKVAEMVRKVESTHSLIESVCYQINAGVDDRSLGGTIAMLKVQATKTLEFCAREASQIFGGACFVRGGVGEKVERIYREVRVQSIGGGSEEVLLSLAMRQARL